jgi:2-hydroxychromene-2-carboxylate isomerase
MANIEYFYAAHSAFAYLGSARFMEIAAAAGRQIVHKPMDLHSVMAAAGSTAFRERGKAHRKYFFGREIARWSEHRNVPLMDRRPTHHDNDYTLANSMLIAGITQGHTVDRLAHAMLESHWRDDADLADSATLSGLGHSVGLDPAPLLQAALTPEIQSIYEANTAEAIERSVFGSPTYFIDGDMFYGQDRLELVERALTQPYADAWPRG